MTPRRIRILIPLWAVIVGVAWAQTDTQRLDALERELLELRQQLQAQEASSGGSSLEAGWDNGFYVRSSDKQFKLTWNARVQADARFFEPDHPSDNTFLVRRARMALKAQLWKMFEGKVEIDAGRNAGNGRAVLTDGYLNMKLLDELQLRAGQYKEPFGMEENTSSRFISFIERTMATNAIAPGRDIGFMVHGKVADGILNYALGVFNGNGSNQQRDADDDKDVALRLTFSPFAGNDNMWLKGLHFGGAFTWGRRDQDEPELELETQLGSEWFIMADTVVHDDALIRWGVELAWLVGPFSLRAEFMQMIFEDLRYGAEKDDFEVDGWYVEASYFITGEDASFKRPKVKDNFNPLNEEFGLGAFQVAARVSQVHAETGIIHQGFASGTDRGTDMTIGLNWWLNPHVVFKLNYVRTWFQENTNLEGETRNDEDGVMLRLQLDF